MSKKRNIASSFGFAIDGIKEALVSEPNFKIHAALGIFALTLAYFLKFNRLEWLILAFTIAFVLILELINTALEAIVDLVSPKVRSTARIAKDVSAAAVLISAALAVIVGLVLFFPKVMSL